MEYLVNIEYENGNVFRALINRKDQMIKIIQNAWPFQIASLKMTEIK